MTELLLALALGAGALSNFPRPAGGPVLQSAIGLNIEGRPAVLLIAGEELAAFRAGGGAPRPFPLPLAYGDVAAGPPAAADMDRDGAAEIAVATTGGKVYLWSGGRLAPGFPVQLGAPCRAGPSFADVDGDGRPELVIGDGQGRLHAFTKSGREAAGWPVALGAAITSSASASRFAGGQSLAVGDVEGRVHVLALPGGQPRPGFPLVTAFEVTGPPAFADLDGDGEMDLLAASRDFRVYAVNGEGRPLAGFPVEAGYRIYGGPAIGDVDGDGRLDVVFASADGWLHAVSADGRKLPGFPVRIGGRAFGSPVIGDLDRDGRLEIAAVSAEGQVVAVDGQGKMLAGFPARLDAQDVAATPLLLDLDGDGTLSIFVGLPSGDLHALRAQRAGAAPAATPWPGAGRDAAHSGRYGPNPPRYAGLALSPLLPHAGEKLTASWRWASPDALPGDPEPVPVVEWYRNGAAVPGLRGKRQVPPGTIAKGELWRFAILPGDPAPAVKSPEVQVLGLPPAGHAVALQPEHPVRGQPVRAVVTRPATDPDGDAISYRYEWLLDGLPTGVEEPTFPGGMLKRGASLAVLVWASDGELESEAALAEGRVDNSPPGAPGVAISSVTIRHGEAPAAKIVRQAPDADGDPIVYHYRWTVDGEPRNYALSAAAYPGAPLRKHQKVRVEVRAFDGEVEGPPVSAEATVLNTAPTAPQVEIWPAEPRRGDSLRAGIVSAAVDADGDPLVYRFAWTKNGAPLAVAGDGREVASSEVRRGDRFEVEAWARDGEEDGPRARAVVTVANSPPEAPLIALKPLNPQGGDDLELTVVRPSRDADGDPVEYDVTWTREGRTLDQRGYRLPGAEMPKNVRIRATVTPRDPIGPGAPARAEVIAANTRPTAPEIALEPREPTAATGLSVRIVKPAADRDGDAISYRYVWTRDGAPTDVDGAAVPLAHLRSGGTWAVEVRAFDGEEPSEPARAAIAVKGVDGAPPPPPPQARKPARGKPAGPAAASPQVNTPPTRPEIALEPREPTALTGMQVRIVRPATDRDGDAVTYRYSWTRDGVPVNLSGPELPKGQLRNGELWAVEVRAFDGKDVGLPAAASATVRNTLPPVPEIAIRPERPTGGQALRCEASAPDRDADGERVEVRIRWYRGAEPVPVVEGAGELPAGLIRRGERWRCEASASDGVGESARARAEVSIPNSPPGAPRVVVEPPEPRHGDALACRLVAEAVDADGDRLRYSYTWWRDDERLAPGADPARVDPKLVKKGQRWGCEAVASDGSAAGPPGRADTLVRDTAPGPARARIRPGSPKAGEMLRCEVIEKSVDPDGDPVRYTFAWTRNGQSQPFGAGADEVPGRLVAPGDRWRCVVTPSDGELAGPIAATPEIVVEGGAALAPRARR